MALEEKLRNGAEKIAEFEKSMAECKEQIGKLGMQLKNSEKRVEQNKTEIANKVAELRTAKETINRKDDEIKRAKQKIKTQLKNSREELKEKDDMIDFMNAHLLKVVAHIGTKTNIPFSDKLMILNAIGFSSFPEKASLCLT